MPRLDRQHLLHVARSDRLRVLRFAAVVGLAVTLGWGEAPWRTPVLLAFAAVAVALFAVMPIALRRRARELAALAEVAEGRHGPPPPATEG